MVATVPPVPAQTALASASPHAAGRGSLATVDDTHAGVIGDTKPSEASVDLTVEADEDDQRRARIVAKAQQRAEAKARTATAASEHKSSEMGDDADASQFKSPRNQEIEIPARARRRLEPSLAETNVVKLMPTLTSAYPHHVGQIAHALVTMPEDVLQPLVSDANALADKCKSLHEALMTTDDNIDDAQLFRAASGASIWA